MLKILVWGLLVLLGLPVNGQTSTQKLNQAMAQFANDSQIIKANVSFCMINANTGKILFERNKDKLLPPASTIKTFTTASALHYLGEKFRYETKFAFKGVIKNGTALGELIIYGSGDPSLGSDRFPETNPTEIFKQIENALLQKGIKNIKGKITFVNTIFNDSCSNAHWLEEDYGNYYGAGIFPFNWKENKFEIKIKAANNTFKVIENNGGLDNVKDFKMELVAKPGAGTEESFAYITPDSSYKYAIRGALACNGNTETMSLANINPSENFKRDLIAYLKTKFTLSYAPIDLPIKEIPLLSIYSPPLHKLVSACNQKSLNLYAESFCKTIGLFQGAAGNWSNGILYMKKFADAVGVKSNAITLYDASGLSPQNSISTFALSSLLYAYTKQNWISVFKESLPLINNLTMKSGYIGGTRSYTGYITLTDGTPVSFAFIVNNFEGKPRTVKEKMFKVLDVLKE